jgi:purine-binding chemotaxis protein CheW
VVQLVVFTLDSQRFALHLSAVIRVLPAMEITSLPKAPAIVSGLINLKGMLFPVFNIRRRLDFPERELELNDRFIVAETGGKSVVLIVDDVLGVFNYSEARIESQRDEMTKNGYVSGIVKLDDGLIYIHDIESFLSPSEEAHLREALSQLMEGNKKEQPPEKTHGANNN